MITRGEVKSIRELSGDRVQAQVCLGADPQLGSATVQVELNSAAVREALKNLREVISNEALGITAGIIAEHKKWERALARRRAKEEAS